MENSNNNNNCPDTTTLTDTKRDITTFKITRIRFTRGLKKMFKHREQNALK